MLKNCIFITGTDTGIGKTYVTVKLLQALNREGLRTFAIKPLASGGEYDEQGNLKNEDAVLLQKAASLRFDYQRVNPIMLTDAVAPHIAAQRMSRHLSVDDIKTAFQKSIVPEADMNVIEGCGGWAVPLNDQQLMSDAIKELQIPVILVVGIKLGCLNHAILTAKSIASQAPFLGWIGNCIDPNMAALEENIATLKQWLPAPCLGIVPYKQISNILNTAAIMAV